MTLQEMIDKYGFGVKFTLSNDTTKYWFTPMGLSANGKYATGESSCAFSQYFDLSLNDWRLYAEPKPKKKINCEVWLHFYKSPNGEIDFGFDSSGGVTSIGLHKVFHSALMYSKEVEVDDE